MPLSHHLYPDSLFPRPYPTLPYSRRLRSTLALRIMAVRHLSPTFPRFMTCPKCTATPGYPIHFTSLSFSTYYSFYFLIIRLTHIP
ncbi:hypothetical protein BDW62DRAFT_192321 [Aspergillus aurantiobrunneus]